MAAELATPRYLNWSQYPIQFSREDQWTSIGNVGHYPRVLDPTITGMTVTKVLINGGAGLNIIFLETLRKMGLQLAGMITPTSTPFYGIVPGKAAMPLGQITLPVTFGTPSNYRTEFIKFEVADFDSSYHAILGRPGVPRELAEHRIDINEGSKPVKQRLRRFSPDKKAAIKKEITKLMAAGFIREISILIG